MEFYCADVYITSVHITFPLCLLRGEKTLELGEVKIDNIHLKFDGEDH